MIKDGFLEKIWSFNLKTRELKYKQYSPLKDEYITKRWSLSKSDEVIYQFEIQI